jgi:hypothetical protein
LANEKRWAEAIAVAHRILETGPFTLERAYPSINLAFAVGHIDETIEMVDRLRRMEPLAMYLSRDQQWNLSGGRRYAAAEAEFRRSLDLERSHAEPDSVAFLRTLALKPDDTTALHETYKGFRRWFGPSAQDLYLTKLDPVLDDRLALRARIRKVVRERQPAFEHARFIADAIGESESAFESLQAWMDQPHLDFRKYWQT